MVITNKVCAACEKNFIASAKNQKFCKNPCGLPKTEAQKWLDAKPKKGNGMDSNQVGYSFFRKKYLPSKRYQACRG